MRLIDADALIEKCGGWYVEEGTESGFIGTLKNLLATEPTIQPEERTDKRTETRACDLIDRYAAIDKFIDSLEEIFADLRERHVDTSVCGLCEYDGAYIGQSGDWCNECPGFEKDDCFKLSDKTRKKWTEEIIKALPNVQLATDTNVGDTISRQAAVELAMKYCPDDDGAVHCDGDIRGLLDELENLPPAPPPECATGFWLIRRWGDDAKCSNCGKTFKDVYDMESYDGFCRHCGTKMEGIRREDDSN